MNTVDSILALSDVPNEARYRHYLEELPEKKRGELLENLKKDAPRIPRAITARRQFERGLHLQPTAN